MTAVSGLPGACTPSGGQDGRAAGAEGGWSLRRQAAACLLILLAVWAAYANSLRCPFHFDDDPLYWEGRPPSWQERARAALAGSRPLTDLTLALNYAIGGTDVPGYHVFNISVHALAGCALFLLVRRVLRAPALRERYTRAADALALATALLWALHPIQTQSVTYIVQRAESMTGLFYLLTLYAALRGFRVGEDGQTGVAVASGRGWYVLAVVCCAAGMATKPVMATAPIMVLVFDRLLGAGGWAGALRRRWGFYLALAATWLVLVQTVLAQGHTESAGFGFRGFTAWEYACTQPRAILWYLRLAFWPHPLCFDYVRPVLRDWTQFALPAAVVLLLVGVTLFLLARSRPSALFGVWFFLILSVTSSFMPIADVCVEHRVYLSLAAVVAAVVLGGYESGCFLLRRMGGGARVGAALGWGGVAVLALLGGWRTIERNRDYRSQTALWESVLRVRPDNLRAKLFYGYGLFTENRVDEAIAVTQDPARAGDPAAHLNLGRFYATQGRLSEAEASYRAALALDPNFAKAHYNLGNLLLTQGRTPEAASAFSDAVKADPTVPRAHNNLGIALARMGRLPEAERHFREALRLDPGYSAARQNLERLLRLTGRGGEASPTERE